MKYSLLILIFLFVVNPSWTESRERLTGPTLAAHSHHNNHKASAGGANQRHAQSSRKKASPEIVRLFNRWLGIYAELRPRTRQHLEFLAKRMAKTRRSKMRTLMIVDPAAAVDLAVSASLRAKLPPSVNALLERQVDGFGEVIRVECLREFDGQEFVQVETEDTWLNVGEDEFFNPAVYGRRLSQRSKRNLPIHGIALDEIFAWSELPLRILDPSEKKAYGYDEETLVALIGDEALPFQNLQELALIRNRIIDAEERFGPLLPPLPELIDGDAEPHGRDYMTGVKSLLWLPVNFNELPESRFTRSADTDYTIAQADEWLQASSRGKTSLDVTYFPGILRLRAGALDDFRRSRGSIVSRVKEALEGMDRANGSTGYWLADSWDRIAIVVSDIDAPEGGVYQGAFTNGGVYMTFYGLIDRFSMQHELGHSYIFGHSDYLRPSTSDLSGPGTLFFGMKWDYMGQGLTDQRSHPNGLYKRNAYWLEDTEWIDATDGGRFNLFAHDTAPPDIPMGLLIRTDDAREYWVDMRRLWPEETGLHDGVQIHYWEKREPTEIFPLSVQAIGRQPGASIQSSAFVEGDVFEDAGRGVRIIIRSVGMDPFRFGVHTALVDVERF